MVMPSLIKVLNAKPEDLNLIPDHAFIPPIKRQRQVDRHDFDISPCLHSEPVNVNVGQLNTTL